MDQNGTSKVVEQSKMKEMNKFKEEEEEKEKIQWILVDFKVIRGELGNKPKEFQPVRLFLETGSDPIAMTENTQKCLCLFFSSALL